MSWKLDESNVLNVDLDTEAGLDFHVVPEGGSGVGGSGGVGIMRLADGVHDENNGVDSTCLSVHSRGSVEQVRSL